MSPKNFNIFEQHVEKIALAIGLAGAGYLIWLGMQPMTVPGTQIELDNVEAKVSSAVKELTTAQDATAKRPPITVKVPNLVEEYENSLKDPLPKILTVASAPRFVPLQAPLTAIDYAVARVGSGEVITPAVPSPQNNVAVSWRGLIFDSQPGIAPPAQATPAVAPTPVPGAGAAAAAPGVPSKDKNLIAVSGSLPIDTFKKTMDDQNVKIEQRLPGDKQIPTVYRVEAMRRQRVGHNWSPWTPVTLSSDVASAELPTFPRNPMSADPSQIDVTLTQLKDSLLKIIQPLSYYTPEGRPVLSLMLTPPASLLVPGALGPNGQPLPLPAPTAAPAASPAPSAPAYAGDTSMDKGPAPAPRAAAPAPAAPAPAPATPAAAPAGPPSNDPVYWIVDENVQPDTEYQYEVRLVMYNPTFNYQYNGGPGKLADEKMRDQVTIASPWAVLPNTVQIGGDKYFYVTNNIGVKADELSPRVGAFIYKWTMGHWFVDRNAQGRMGMPITGNIVLPDHKSQQVATGNIVVDVVPTGQGIGGGNDIDAIMLTPDGELVVRKASQDTNDTNRLRIDKDVWKPAAPPPPAPKTPAAPKPGAPGAPAGPFPGGTGGSNGFPGNGV